MAALRNVIVTAVPMQHLQPVCQSYHPEASSERRADGPGSDTPGPRHGRGTPAAWVLSVSNDEQQTTSTAAELSGLVDAVVRLPTGSLLGHIEELLLNLRSGRIDYLIVRVSNGERRPIPWGAVEFRDGEFWVLTRRD
jgi:hypothetical protein